MRPLNRTPSLCVVKRKRSTTRSHQEDKGMALDHCLAENESVQENNLHYCMQSCKQTQNTKIINYKMQYINCGRHIGLVLCTWLVCVHFQWTVAPTFVYLSNSNDKRLIIWVTASLNVLKLTLEKQQQAQTTNLQCMIHLLTTITQF